MLRPLLTAGLAVLLVFCAAPPVLAQSDADETRTVRVRLFDAEAPRAAVLRADGGPLDLLAGDPGSPLFRLERGEAITVNRRGEELRVVTPTGALFAQALRVVPVEDDAAWSVEIAGGPSARTYAGALALTPDPADAQALHLVNAAPLEAYVASVVAGEYGFDDLEGSKAMAVVARTYALHDAEKYGPGYDLVDHVGSQVYGGTEAVTPVAREAAESTRGEILTHRGAPIEAVYSASSGGHTANNEDVWDATEVLPYLRGKRDPYDGASPHKSWRTTVARSELLSRLSARHGFDARGFTIEDRSRDGRVSTVKILGPGGRSALMQANAFRLFVNEQTSGYGLRSTFFDAERRGDQYVFEGRGYGHGVGLSQYGAREMARQGYDYRDILSFYYTDVALETLDGTLEDPLPAAPLAQQPPPRPERGEEKETPTKRRVGW